MSEYSNLAGLLDREVILTQQYSPVRTGVVYIEGDRTPEFLFQKNETEIGSIYLLPEEYSVQNKIISVSATADINNYSLCVPVCGCTKKVDTEGFEKRKAILKSILAQYSIE